MDDFQLEFARMRRQIRQLQYYAVATTFLILGAIGFSFSKSDNSNILKSLRAEKIEIVEKDGTVTLTPQDKQHSGIFIHDKNGIKRLEVTVNEKNEPQILLYDAKGSVIKKIGV